MRAFSRFVGLLLFALLLAACVTYPAWWLVLQVSEQPVHRVMQRIAMLVALFGLIVLLRREGLAHRQALGYGLPLPEFLRQAALGFAAGLVVMIPLVAGLLGAGIRVLKPEFIADGAARAAALVDLGALVLQGALTGGVVAFIEETFFRGALQTAVERDTAAARRPWREMAPILLPSLLYAAVHFLGGRLRIPASEVNWISGFAVFGNLLERYAQPLALADSYLALVAVGTLLGLVRRRTGAIAACIGLHAGWVCVITSLRSTTDVDRGAPATWLVGSYDGVIGWGATALIFVLIAALLWAVPAADRPADRPAVRPPAP